MKATLYFGRNIDQTKDGKYYITYSEEDNTNNIKKLYFDTASEADNQLDYYFHSSEQSVNNHWFNVHNDPTI